MMTLVRTVPPTAYPVSLVEAKTHLNVMHPDTDAKIDQFIAAMTERLDGWTGTLGRAIMPQTWTMYSSGFSSQFSPVEVEPLNNFFMADAPMEIPLPPLISVDAVQYVDDTGSILTMPDSDYEVILGGDMNSYIKPVFGSWWPVPRCQPNSVRITFTAGWPIGQTPERIKQAMFLAISHWYENREGWDPTQMMELPLGVRDILAPLRFTPV